MKPSMLKRSCFHIIVAGLVFVLSACTPPAAKGSKSAAGYSEGRVVATFGSQTLTLEELDLELGEQLYMAREQLASRMAFERILDEKAQEMGVTPEVFWEKLIEERTEAPTEEEIKAVFERSRAQMQLEETAFESVREDIAKFLRHQSAQSFLPEIQEAWLAEANFKFTLTYKPKRVDVEAIGPSMGPEQAKVTIVEFSAFDCPHCRQGAATMAEVMKAYPTQVKLHFRHFPMRAPQSAEASLCANDQGKFWEYHDMLFANQNKLDVESLKEYAKSLELDEAQFAECLETKRHAEAVKKDMEAGRKAKVQGTPAFFINGVFLGGARPIEKFKELIEEALQAP